MLQLSAMRSSSAGGAGTPPATGSAHSDRPEDPRPPPHATIRRAEATLPRIPLLSGPGLPVGVRDARPPRDTPSDLCVARSRHPRDETEQGSIAVVPEPRAGVGRILELRRRIIRARRRSADGSAMVAWRSSPLIGRFGPFPIYVAFVEDLPPMPPTPQGGSPRCAR